MWFVSPSPSKPEWCFIEEAQRSSIRFYVIRLNQACFKNHSWFKAAVNILYQQWITWLPICEMYDLFWLMYIELSSDFAFPRSFIMSFSSLFWHLAAKEQDIFLRSWWSPKTAKTMEYLTYIYQVSRPQLQMKSKLKKNKKIDNFTFALLSVVYSFV